MTSFSLLVLLTNWQAKFSYYLNMWSSAYHLFHHFQAFVQNSPNVLSPRCVFYGSSISCGQMSSAAPNTRAFLEYDQVPIQRCTPHQIWSETSTRWATPNFVSARVSLFNFCFTFLTWRLANKIMCTPEFSLDTSPRLMFVDNVSEQAQFFSSEADCSLCFREKSPVQIKEMVWMPRTPASERVRFSNRKLHLFF